MNLFAGFATFISLIEAIALSRILIGLAYLIEQKHRVTWSWVFVTWGIFFVIAITDQWWQLFVMWEGFSSFTIHEFWYLLISPVLFVFISALFFPRFPDTGHIDLWEHFNRVRPWCFTLGALYIITYIPEAAMVASKRGQPFTSELSLGEVASTITMAILFAVGAFVHSRKYHAFLPPAVILLFLGFYFCS